MQFLNKIQGEYDQLWKYIVRPTRTPYPDTALGPQTFCLQNIKVKRNSFQLINDRGHVFFGSHFVPLQSNSYPCLIYLHGNSSNQTEGMQYLSDLIKNNISLVTFDFSGCGNSQGQYVTLGYYQWKDLEQVYLHIKSKQKVNKIGIWGRSMGAVTALRFIAKHPQISVGIYDSPFKSLKSLVGDLCKKNSKIPAFILSGALKIIAGTIKQKANFDIYDLDPLKNESPIIKVPGFFIVSQQDQLIPCQHSKLLYQAYKSKKKQIRIIKGDHNSTRPEACIKQVIKYLKKYLIRAQKLEGREKNTSVELNNKIEDIDFFNDELPQQIDTNNQMLANLSVNLESEDLDFFPQSQITKKQKQKSDEYSFQQNKNEFYGNSLLSSLNQMLSGVFSSQSSTSKKAVIINDGYDEIRSRISAIRVGLEAQAQTEESKKQSRRKNKQKIIETQLAHHDPTFQNILLSWKQINNFSW